MLLRERKFEKNDKAVACFHESKLNKLYESIFSCHIDFAKPAGIPEKSNPRNYIAEFPYMGERVTFNFWHNNQTRFSSCAADVIVYNACLQIGDIRQGHFKRLYNPDNMIVSKVYLEKMWNQSLKFHSSVCDQTKGTSIV